MKVKELKAHDVRSYLGHIFEHESDNSAARCYRGQADIAWKLKPSVLRDLKSNAESQIFSEMMLEAPSEFGGDKSMFDKLVRAQHYGLPTRLLDVSLNPLVGLYFACNETEHHSRDGVVEIFDFLRSRVKFADSDTVSLISNLARLSDKEKDTIRSFLKSNKIQEDIKKLNEFRDLPPMRRLSQFVRTEKSYFLDIANPVDLQKYYFVYPLKNNRRVIAQSGAFIVAGLLLFEKPAASNGIKIKKIKIPHEAKKNIINQLDLLNVNSRTMFPEVEFASKYIKEKWTQRKSITQTDAL